MEINQCVGCTREFFTKSFLGDDACVLARSSGGAITVRTRGRLGHVRPAGGLRVRAGPEVRVRGRDPRASRYERAVDDSTPVWKSTSVSGARGRPGSVELRGTGIATPSSRHRVDGVEVDAKIQRERAVKF